MIETSQNMFQPMQGHVMNGTVVRMNNGDVLTLRAQMNGWVLDGPNGSSSEMPTAAEVEWYVIHYPCPVK